MQEVLGQRTLTSKTFALGNGEFRLDSHIDHIHYDDGVTLQEIDTTIVPSKDGGFEVSKAGFDVTFDPLLSAKSPFIFDNEGQKMGLFPRGLRWADGTVISQDLTGVSGKTNGSVIEYPGAFGSHDLLFEVIKTGVRKIVRINSLLNGGTGVLEVGFEIIAPAGFEVWYTDPANQKLVEDIRQKLSALDKERLRLEKEEKKFDEARAIFEQQKQLELDLHDAALSKWDMMTDTTFAGEFQVRVGGVKTYFRAPTAWDSGRSRWQISVQLRKRNGKYYLAKLIPIEILKEAVYPLMTDTTTSFYAGAGDGRVQYTGAAAWSTARDAATGTFANYTDAEDYVGGFTHYNGSTYSVVRGFLPTDTSALTSGATISSATLNIWPTDKADTNTTRMEVIQTSQASTSSLATSDFSAVTFTSGGNINISSVSTGSYNTITLNATGLTWISKTGFTKIGGVNGRDYDNSAPTGLNYVYGYFSEQTSTTNDPYLSVTYTVAAATSPNLLLLGVG